MTLGQGAWLDRDFVLRLDGLEGPGLLRHCARRRRGPAAGASRAGELLPAAAGTQAPALSLKILGRLLGLDGGRQHPSRRGARTRSASGWSRPTGIAFPLRRPVRAGDPELEPCTPQLVTRYGKAIEQTEADLGGTELHAALLQVFGPQSKGTTARADVLLITDGEVWDIEPTVKAARESGHRLFVVGVSNSPAESLLRELAEQSGGACELVTPNEISRVITAWCAGCAPRTTSVCGWTGTSRCCGRVRCRSRCSTARRCMSGPGWSSRCRPHRRCTGAPQAPRAGPGPPVAGGCQRHHCAPVRRPPGRHPDQRRGQARACAALSAGDAPDQPVPGAPARRRRRPRPARAGADPP